MSELKIPIHIIKVYPSGLEKAVEIIECFKLSECPFYQGKMPMERGIGAIYRKKYCNGNFEICARYRVLTSVGASYVPDSLYPGMQDIADSIIREVTGAV